MNGITPGRGCPNPNFCWSSGGYCLGKCNMNNSADYNHHHRDLDLIQYTSEELVERYRAHKPLTLRQVMDAERIIAAEEKKS